MIVSVTLINKNLFFHKEHDKDYRKEKQEYKKETRKEKYKEKRLLLNPLSTRKLKVCPSQL
jgi:hypothetical protein